MAKRPSVNIPSVHVRPFLAAQGPVGRKEDPARHVGGCHIHSGDNHRICILFNNSSRISEFHESADFESRPLSVPCQIQTEAETTELEATSLPASLSDGQCTNGKKGKGIAIGGDHERERRIFKDGGSADPVRCANLAKLYNILT